MKESRFLWQIIGFLALLGMAPLTGYVIIKLHSPQIEREAFVNLEAIAELKSGQIENWLNERYNDGVVLMSTDSLVAQVSDVVRVGDASSLAVLRHSLSAAVDAVQYDVAMVLDPDGRILLSLGKLSLAETEVVMTLTAAFESGRPQRSEFIADEGGGLRLAFVVPLFRFENSQRLAVGAVVLHVRPEAFLFPYIQHWPSASTSGEALLVGRDSDSLLYLNNRAGGQSAQRLSMERTEVPEVEAVKEQRAGVRQGFDPDGVPVLAAYRPVTGTDWMVVARLDREEVMAPLRDLAFWVSLVALVGILSVGVVIFMLLQQRRRTFALQLQTQSDEMLRRFFDLPFIGIAMSSPTTKRWLQFNDKLCEILGYSREEMTRVSWAEMTHPDDLAADEGEFDRLLRGQTTGYSLEKRFIRKNGATVHAALEVRCVRRDDGTLDHVFATVQDISERKQAEASIHRLTQIYAALSECNQAIVRCTSEEELYPQVCRLAVQFGGMKLAWIGLIDDGAPWLRTAACFGEGAEEMLKVRISADPDSPYGKGALGTAIREKQPVWIQDYLNDTRTAAWHDQAARGGWGAVAALPLLRDEEVVGAFALITSEPNAFDEAARNLLAEMAIDISFALTLFSREDERRKMESDLRASENRFRGLYEKAPLAYQSLDIEGNILEVNEAWLTLLGYRREEVMGRFIGDFLTEASIQTLSCEFPRFQEKGRFDGPVFQLKHKDGSLRLLMINGQIARDSEGHFLRTHCILTDLTQRLQAEEQLRLAAQVFEYSAEGIMITDPEARIMMVNRAFSTITGYPVAEVIGKNPSFLSSGRHDIHYYQNLWASIDTAGYWQGEMWNRRKGGDIYPELLSISRVLDDQGKVTHYVGIFSDISEHKQSQAHIQRLAHYDSLTGLPNRSLLTDRVGQAISRMERQGELLALVFLDLDRFKNVNDSLGHRIGDELLIQVAERLKQTLRDEDTVSRLGGDEFILVLPGSDADGAAHVAEKVIKAISRPFTIEQYELSVTTSIGIAMFPADGDSYEALSMRADAAMYRAKQGGRNAYRFFTREMQERSDKTLKLENALHRALELQQLELHYQPQISLETGTIVGVEALLRWTHPELGQIPPSEFIPVAEDSGLILPIGEWVLRTAVCQMRSWVDGGAPLLTMAVNLSAVQFRQTSLAERVGAILDEAGLPAHHLELELTEGVAMDNPQGAVAVMNSLHERGILMSIDDFGTGYSSLSYLKRFSVHRLKIDQSFVSDMSSDSGDAAIVESIINLARGLGLKTVAEGVETAEQVEFLRAKGCAEVQGYFFTKALPADEFEVFMREFGGCRGDASATQGSGYNP